MIKLFYFLLCFLMCFFGVILSIHFNLWIGLSIAILFGIKFILLIPNTNQFLIERRNPSWPCQRFDTTKLQTM